MESTCPRSESRNLNGPDSQAPFCTISITGFPVLLIRLWHLPKEVKIFDTGTIPLRNIFFFLKLDSSDFGNEKAHNVFLGGITVIIRIIESALFHFTVCRNERAREARFLFWFH